MKRKNTGWTKKQKDIIATIYEIASDERYRVLNTDQIEWLETKLKEIKRLSKKLLPTKK